MVACAALAAVVASASVAVSSCDAPSDMTMSTCFCAGSLARASDAILTEP